MTNNTKDPTYRQLAMLGFIAEYMGEHVYSPTIREIVQGARLTATSVCTYNLDKLAQMGYLTRDPNTSRSIKLLTHIDGDRVLITELFEGAEAQLVKTVFGRNPRRRILELCRIVMERQKVKGR